MSRNKILLLLLLLLLTGIGYGAAKYRRYSIEWKRFDNTWHDVKADLSGNYSYKWKPGLFSASGEMNLSNCQVTDESVEKLRGLTTLVRLDLSNNDLTDVAIDPLLGMTNLRELDIRRTQITDEAVQSLKLTLPDIQVIR